MKRLILALLLLAAPAMAQTRLTFGYGDQYFFPAFDAGWEETGEGVRGYLHVQSEIGSNPYRGRGPGISNGGHVQITANSANQALDRQFQLRLNPGTTFTSGVTTVTMQAMLGETASGDDITQCILGIRVINEDLTVQATLLPVANYGTTTELAVFGGGRNKTCANGDTVQATVTAVEGDYLIVEVGYQSDGTTGASPGASIIASDGGGLYDSVNRTDCPVDETNTGCIAWIEFSNTFTRDSEGSLNATKLWFPASTAADVTPAVTSGWTESDEVAYHRLEHEKGSSTMANGQTVDITGGAHRSEVDRFYVSDPMAAGVVFTEGQTTINAAFTTLHTLATNDQVYGVTMSASIVSQDGSAQRAILMRAAFNQGFMGFAEGNRGAFDYVRWSIIAHPVDATYTTVSGDRLMIGVGGTTLSGGTTPQFVSRYGESVSDCPGGQIFILSTTDCAPWVAFSNTITFASESRRVMIVDHLPPRPWLYDFLKPRQFLASLLGRL